MLLGLNDGFHPATSVTQLPAQVNNMLDTNWLLSGESYTEFNDSCVGIDFGKVNLALKVKIMSQNC